MTTPQWLGAGAAAIGLLALLASSDPRLEMEEFSRAKRRVRIGEVRVAYTDRGSGPPVLLLHGCPFQSYLWRNAIRTLEATHRVLAPDLLGLGDTEVSLEADYRLPVQLEMILGFLDAMGVESAAVVGHDHGAAIAQMMAAYHPERVERLVLSNGEAYDNWPSDAERPEVEWVVAPFFGGLARFGLRFEAIQRAVFRSAVHRPETLTPELLRAVVRPLIRTRARWHRTQRFLRGQLDPEHNRETGKLVDGLRRFDRPTLLLWGRDDPHFGPEWAERLAGDIPGPVRVELIPNAGHLVMEDQPEAFLSALKAFLDEPRRQSATEPGNRGTPQRGDAMAQGSL